MHWSAAGTILPRIPKQVAACGPPPSSRLPGTPGIARLDIPGAIKLPGGKSNIAPAAQREHRGEALPVARVPSVEIPIARRNRSSVAALSCGSCVSRSGTPGSPRLQFPGADLVALACHPERMLDGDRITRRKREFDGPVEQALGRRSGFGFLHRGLMEFRQSARSWLRPPADG